MANPIKNKLKSERLKLGLSQKNLAAIGGVSVKSQCMYENGSRFPDTRYLTRVAATGIDIQYVVTGQRLGDGSPAIPASQIPAHFEEMSLEEITRLMTQLSEIAHRKAEDIRRAIHG
jgi:transcriptional regulator with XRE-family HTH domain